MPMNKATFSLCLLLFLVNLQPVYSQSFTEAFTEMGYSAVEQTEAVQLFKKDGNYLVGFNLQKMNVSSFQAVDSTKKSEVGNFLDNISSPFFNRIAYQDVIDNNEDAYIINASFFESYKSSTQLSYPIYTDDNWITSGSSIYGPTKQPKDEYYGEIELLALQIGSESAKITAFEKENNPKDLIMVSQNYKDHPALILANNRVTRFLLVTTLDENEDGKDEWLLLSIGLGNIVDRASELEKVNKQRYIMTLDGGSSVFFSHPTLGVLQKPARYNPVNFQEMLIDLPHYLVIKKK